MECLQGALQGALLAQILPRKAPIAPVTLPRHLPHMHFAYLPVECPEALVIGAPDGLL